jgi:hypothetical protein
MPGNTKLNPETSILATRHCRREVNRAISILIVPWAWLSYRRHISLVLQNILCGIDLAIMCAYGRLRVITLPRDGLRSALPWEVIVTLSHCFSAAHNVTVDASAWGAVSGLTPRVE